MGDPMKFFAILAVVLIMVMAVLSASEERMLYFPSRMIEMTPGQGGIKDVEDVYFKAGDGVELNGWWFPVQNARWTLILFHGNAGDISHRLFKQRIFRSMGLQVFLFDYRGYGRSGGKPSEKGLYRDAAAAYDFLINQKRILPDSILLYGESLGGAVAIELGLNKSVRAVIVEDTFTSVKDMARVFYPWVPLVFVPDKYNSAGKIQRLKSSLLIFHSLDDEIVPYAMGKKLYENAGGAKSLATLRGGHNSAVLDSEQLYRKRFLEFLKTLESDHAEPALH